MRNPKSFSPRVVLGAIFCVVVFVILATIAARTGRTFCVGQHNNGGCEIVSFMSAYWANVGMFIEANEGPIEACGTLFVAIFTFTLWTATEKLGDLAKEQGEAMERSISESAKATLATNAIATATKENAALMQGILHKQMRAYLSVEPGLGTYQDKYLRFASAPVVTNTGYTPARNVSYQVMAAILDTHLRDDHVFETFGTKTTNDAGVAPRQSVIISAVVRERFPDGEVEPIMSGEARRLYVWGTVTYDDIFGGSWKTMFCHNFVFFKHGDDNVQVKSYFHNCHNSGT